MAIDYKKIISQTIDEHQRLVADFFHHHSELLIEAAEAIAGSFAQGGKLLLFGNGGSSADAQHIAAEFVHRYLLERPPLPAIALTSSPPLLTSIANDLHFASIFSLQIRALGKKGDIAWGISTSGNSSNVVEGVKTATEIGLVTIGLTGRDGGKLKGLVTYPIIVGHQLTPRIQEVHILVGHLICQLVEEKLFKDAKPEGMKGS